MNVKRALLKYSKFFDNTNIKKAQDQEILIRANLDLIMGSTSAIQRSGNKLTRVDFTLNPYLPGIFNKKFLPILVMKIPKSTFILESERLCPYNDYIQQPI